MFSEFQTKKKIKKYICFCVFLRFTCQKQRKTQGFYRFWGCGWLVGWLAGWHVGWLAGWLAGSSAGWLAVRRRLHSPHCQKFRWASKNQKKDVYVYFLNSRPKNICLCVFDEIKNKKVRKTICLYVCSCSFGALP